ncbi:MAG: hypothetical protein JKX99_01810 [Robiginitomaculum sp.]|nr:hypothetical protein [Robiginitomaculum sp.]
MNTKEIYDKLNAIAKSFWFLAIIAIIFGYNIGKDRALRDNARDNAATEITYVQLGKPDV